MRQSTIFFVLGLLVLARAEVNVFAELDQQPFGTTLLNLVQMNMQSHAQAEMKTEESMSSIVELLADLQNTLRQQKAIADANHKDFQEKAAYDIEKFSKILDEQQTRLANSLRQIAIAKQNLAAATADLAQSQAHLKDVQAQIKAADALNLKSVVAFEKKTTELAQAIQACKDAVVELGKLNYGVLAEGQSINMAQIKSGMEKIETALSKHLPTRLTIYRPIITALVDMGTKSDPQLVKQVVALINQLRNVLEAELNASVKSERVRVADYNRIRTDLVNDERNTNKRIGRNLTVISSLKRNIKKNQAIVGFLKVAIVDSQRTLSNRRAEKAFEAAQYAKNNAVRVSELSVFATLIKYVQTKFASAFSAYLRSRNQ